MLRLNAAFLADRARLAEEDGTDCLSASVWGPSLITMAILEGIESMTLILITHWLRTEHMICTHLFYDHNSDFEGNGGKLRKRPQVRNTILFKRERKERSNEYVLRPAITHD